MTPLAAKKASLPPTRSSTSSTRSIVVAGVDGRLALLVVARPEAAEDLAAEALDRGGRDDALRRAADSPEQVDAGARP